MRCLTYKEDEIFMKHIRLRNPKNGNIKEIKRGVSWVYLIFGGWALLFSGRWLYILVELILNILIAAAGTGAPLTIIYHIFLFLFGNRFYANYLVHKKGWVPVSEEDSASL